MAGAGAPLVASTVSGAAGWAALGSNWAALGVLRLLPSRRIAPAMLHSITPQLGFLPLPACLCPLPLQVGGTTVDHGSYLVPRGSADIFFPTHFPLLAALYRQAAARAAAAAATAQPRGRRQRPSSGASSSTSASGDSGGDVQEVAASRAAAAAEAEAETEHLPTAAFMQRHCPDLGQTRTASGYNPLLEDYSNTAFFLGSSSSSSTGSASSSNYGSAAGSS